MKKGSVSAVIIGNEVLSAKVEEQNGALLTKRLREKGIPLRLIVTVPDEVDVIVESLCLARRASEYVFTSGGIGPTHDDVTVRAVAMALGKSVVHLPQMLDLLHRHFSTELTKESLRLAEAPEGAQLILQDGLWYPVLSCEGIYMLPGVPQLFARQLETVLSRLSGNPVVLRSIFLVTTEATIAHVLDQVALENPEVSIGSYPTFDASLGYKVKLTIEHDDRRIVEGVVKKLISQLPPESVVSVE